MRNLNIPYLDFFFINTFLSLEEFQQTLALLYCTIIKVMESYIMSVLNKFDKSGKLYQLNH